MARVIALLAVIFGLLVSRSPASAIEAPTDVSPIASVYRAPIYDQATSYIAHERGPPVRTYDHTALGAFDYQSHGALSLTGFAPGPGYTAYDEAELLAQIASAMGTPQGPGRATSGDLSSVQPAGVAAKSADEFVDLASAGRRNHILYGDVTGGGHLWPGLPGKTPFPEGWSPGRVMHEVSDVATDPNFISRAGRGGSTIVTGTRDGVDI